MNFIIFRFAYSVSSAKLSSVMLANGDILDAFQGYLDRLRGGQYSLLVIAAELLLIGVVVYSVLSFLQGTRGARLVKGVLLVLLAAFLVVRLVAQQFLMERITFLYPYFVSAVFLVALVVFQTELRRGLIRLGEGQLFMSRRKSVEKVVEPIVEAATQLSKSRTGALIAIERQTEIGATTESGVRLDAELSAELLINIFWPATPLHDMGVVIQQGRISAAACQFPLADFEEVDRNLGSRHRAALGMSQECDAVVVVVSEETGTISIALRGQLIRKLTPQDLRRRLYAELESDQPPSESIHEKGPAEKMDKAAHKDDQSQSSAGSVPKIKVT